jgi:ABC-2 type transport system ATP-binding protein
MPIHRCPQERQIRMTTVATSEVPIQVQNLTCCFGRTCALDDVSLEVPRGGVFGLVGENGAGKTTLIKHILGLYRSEAGTVRLLGRDPAADPVSVLSQVGYLSEFLDLPLWMRVGELLRYSQAFYRTWDCDYAERLRAQLHLDPGARLKELSKGQQAKAGLLVALAFRPDLLVLDEPSSGLDPIARRDILETILLSVGEEGRTVFFSSHLLDEVERVSNRVAMIHQGRIALCGELGQIRHSHHYARVRFESAPASTPAWEGLLEAKGAGTDWALAWCGSPEAIREALKLARVEILEQRAMSLDEIFLARIRRNEK